MVWAGGRFAMSLATKLGRREVAREREAARAGTEILHASRAGSALFTCAVCLGPARQTSRRAYSSDLGRAPAQTQLPPQAHAQLTAHSSQMS
jgi:hypothetical protein